MADYTYRPSICRIDFGEIVSKVSRAHQNAGKRSLACSRCAWRTINLPMLERARRANR